MSTTFNSGTKSGLANAAAVGTAMAEQIRDDLVAHAAWELVEEVTPGTVHWYVMRCLSSVSGLPSDFYFVIARTTATGKLEFTVAEGYNDTTNVLSLFPTNTGNGNASTATVYTYDASGRQTSNTFTLSTTALGTGAGSPRGHTWTPSGTSTNWWIAVHDDGVAICFDGAADAYVYAGAYEWMGDTANTMPVCILGNVPMGSSGIGHITRNPLCISGSYGHFATTVTGPPGSYANDKQLLGYPGTMLMVDGAQGSIAPAAEFALVIGSVTTAAHANNAVNIGRFIGKAKHMRYVDVTGSTNPAFGDTYKMDGTLWVPHLYGSVTQSSGAGHIFDTGIAA